jgi:hypothetical protein
MLLAVRAARAARAARAGKAHSTETTVQYSSSIMQSAAQSAGLQALQKWGDVEFCRSIEIRAAGGGVPSHLPSSKARARLDGEIHLVLLLCNSCVNYMHRLRLPQRANERLQVSSFDAPESKRLGRRSPQFGRWGASPAGSACLRPGRWPWTLLVLIQAGRCDC